MKIYQLARTAFAVGCFSAVLISCVSTSEAYLDEGFSEEASEAVDETGAVEDVGAVPDELNENALLGTIEDENQSSADLKQEMEAPEQIDPDAVITEEDSQSFKLSDERASDPNEIKTPTGAEEIPLEEPMLADEQSYSTPSQSYENDERKDEDAEEFVDVSTAGGSEEFIYIVMKGDSLSLIARRLMSRQNQWRKLANYNQLGNPNLIERGQLIRIPIEDGNRDKVNSFASARTATVTVKRGDSLVKIAKRIYGAPRAWKYLYENNRSVIANPNVIEIGQKLSYLRPASSKRKSRGVADRSAGEVPPTH